MLFIFSFFISVVLMMYLTFHGSSLTSPSLNLIQLKAVDLSGGQKAEEFYQQFFFFAAMSLQVFDSFLRFLVRVFYSSFETYPYDRLLRFGAELVFAICEAKEVEVLIINRGVESTFEEDLAQDVLKIITVFSARLYGSRSGKNKKLLEGMSHAVKAASC